MMTTGTLPSSPILSSAGNGASAISELLSRDPEGLQDQDLDALIELLRQQRARWQALEAQGGGGARGTSRAAGAKLPQSSRANLSDTGL